MTPVDPMEIGRQAAQLDSMHHRLLRVETTMDVVNTKVDTILVTLAEKRGERRVATAIAGFGGTLLGILVGWLSR